MKNCEFPNCQNKARSNSAKYCEKHYYRIRRTGTLNDPVIKGKYIGSHGYVTIKKPNCVATKRKDGLIYEHRYNYYMAHGMENIHCYICKTPLEWEETHIDHINCVKADNRIENLGASCPKCNKARGQHKMKQTIRNRFGKKHTYNGESKFIGDWAETSSIPLGTLRARIQKGWSIERALETPLMRQFSNKKECKPCHKAKSKEENQQRKKTK